MASSLLPATTTGPICPFGLVRPENENTKHNVKPLKMLKHYVAENTHFVQRKLHSDIFIDIVVILQLEIWQWASIKPFNFNEIIFYHLLLELAFIPIKVLQQLKWKYQLSLQTTKLCCNTCSFNITFLYYIYWRQHHLRKNNTHHTIWHYILVCVVHLIICFFRSIYSVIIYPYTFSIHLGIKSCIVLHLLCLQ